MKWRLLSPGSLLDLFDESKHAVFNFPFNASTPELEAFCLSKVRAIRTQGNSPNNTVAVTKEPMWLGCWSKGPENIDHWVEEQVNQFLTEPEGWLILNLHGLDGEGWGPVSPAYLTSLLGRLVKIEHLELLPVGDVLRRSPAIE